MSNRFARPLLILLPAAMALPAACAQEPAPAAPVVASAPTATADAASEPATTDAALPLVVVNKSPTCGCCGLWVEHMRAAGFPVEVRDTHALHSIKERLGVPDNKASCHTAEVAGYIVEGHVPAGDVKRLLAERPDARGLVLPGMPLGSPGMEVPDGRTQAYTVELLGADGSTETFAAH